jgi:hypothetical protein
MIPASPTPTPIEMIRSASPQLAAFGAALALLAAFPAQARNDSIDVPIVSALAKRRMQEITSELPLAFGSASADKVDLLPGEVEVQGVASFYDEAHPRERLSEQASCQHAFEDAVVKLADQARRAHAAAVVGLVSNFKGQLVDDAKSADCHAGLQKTYVALKGRLARSYTVRSTRTLPPSLASAPSAAFAALDDVQSVPISDAGRARYAYFLTLPKPRAFVIFEDGGWRFYWKDPEAMSKALDYCARQGKRCWLYAADDRVVWTADVAGRIGSSAQLRGSALPPQDDHQ